MMTKQDFIALADALAHTREVIGRAYNDGNPYTDAEVQTMYEWAVADVCERANPRFMRDRWLGYIAGENGKNGGKVKPSEADRHIAALKASANPDDQNDPWRA